MWNVLTVPTVWYLTVPDNVECFTFPAVWNFNCPRQCVMFLLFRQFGILTVTDNAEYFYCSNIVVF
jgi:hypothetical protein